MALGVCAFGGILIEGFVMNHADRQRRETEERENLKAKQRSKDISDKADASAKAVHDMLRQQERGE